MTEQEAIDRLEAIYAENMGDSEAIHVEEDRLMMEIIEQFGFTNFVAKYDDATHPRWYA